VIKSRNFETLGDAMKASLEEQKIYQSSKETQRILKGGNLSRNNNQKYCEICNRIITILQINVDMEIAVKILISKMFNQKYIQIQIIKL